MQINRRRGLSGPKTCSVILRSDSNASFALPIMYLVLLIFETLFKFSTGAESVGPLALMSKMSDDVSLFF